MLCTISFPLLTSDVDFISPPFMPSTTWVVVHVLTGIHIPFSPRMKSEIREKREGRK
jgi:hypothetical protein